MVEKLTRFYSQMGGSCINLLVVPKFDEQDKLRTYVSDWFAPKRQQLGTVPGDFFGHSFSSG